MTTFSRLVALAAAALLFTGTAALAGSGNAVAPLNKPAPGAKPQAVPPDGGLGMAILAARVNMDATLIAGSGTTGTVKLGTGTYEVDFDRNVADCFYSAVSFANTVAYYVEPRSGVANGVFLEFTTLGSTSANPTPTDSQFYLTVYCSK